MEYNINIEKLAKQAFIIHHDCCKNPACNDEANEYCKNCRAALLQDEDLNNL